MPDGVATLGFNAQTRHVTVRVDVYGLAPNSTTALQLRQGSCLSLSSSTVATFPAVTADAGGTLSAVVTSDAMLAAGIPPGTAIVAQPSGDLDRTAVPLLCTDIPASNPTGPVRLFAPPQLKPAGTATVIFTPGAHKLTLHITAIGLRPEESYDAAIRRGSCKAQGAVHFAVKGKLVADATGSAVVSSSLRGVDSLPATGWYLSVDRTPSANALSEAIEAGPLLCGDI